MLIGIDPLMPPELLATLARMGHGDELALVDANFPADSTAAHCTEPRVIRLAGLDAPRSTQLITSLMPLDPFAAHCALRMEVDDAPEQLDAVHAEVLSIVDVAKPEGAASGSIERQDFYARAAQCFAVVQCAEARAYGCFILRKGVIF